MTEPEDSDLDWDEVVDVVCVGTSPGVLAYAVGCAASDLDILLINPPAEPDPHTADWYASMTADLSPGSGPGQDIAPGDSPGFSLARVSAPPAPTGKRVTLEPFIGEDLRKWSAHCLRSPYGVMFTQVPELLVPMRADGVGSITAALIGDPGERDLLAWIRTCARERGLDEPENAMAATILENGRIAGVTLDDGYRVAARGGLVLAVGAPSAVPDRPTGGELTVAVVGRPAGRFARVDLLRR